MTESWSVTPRLLAMDVAAAGSNLLLVDVHREAARDSEEVANSLVPQPGEGAAAAVISAQVERPERVVGATVTELFVVRVEAATDAPSVDLALQLDVMSTAQELSEGS